MFSMIAMDLESSTHLVLFSVIIIMKIAVIIYILVLYSASCLYLISNYLSRLVS